MTTVIFQETVTFYSLQCRFSRRQRSFDNSVPPQLALKGVRPAYRQAGMLGIQKPEDSLVVCKRALAEIDKLAQNNDEFPD